MDALDTIIDSLHCYFNQAQATEPQIECTEHALILHLSDEKISPFDELKLNLSKDLFSAHFLIKHALYHLQNRYYLDKRYLLTITLTKVIRKFYQEGLTEITEHDSVKEYYLDIRHYFETEEEDVNRLLTQFWQKFLAQDDRQNALDTLGLPFDADYPSIKKQYRLLAQKNHPDKGGCAKKFVEISTAKKLLDRLFS